MKQIMILQSLYSLAVIILELPTGAFADYFGKKASLVFSSLFLVVGSIIYGLGLNFWHFLAAEIIFGVGTSFASGADRAFLHETLVSIDREDDFNKIEGRCRGLANIGESISSFLGGLIGSISLALTMFVSAIPPFLSFLTGLSFAKPKVVLEREEKTDYLQIIRESLAITRTNKKVLWLALCQASFYALVWSMSWFSQPYLQSLGVPVIYLGLIYTFFYIIVAIGSAFVVQFEKLTNSRPFLAMGFLFVLALFLLGVFPNIIFVPLLSFIWAFKVMSRTLISARVLPLVPKDRAATILSFQSMLGRLAYAVYIPILGIAADALGVNSVFLINGLVATMIFSALVFSEKKFNLKLENI